MMIQIKEGDPDVVQKFQRRGPGSRYAQWLPSFANLPERVRTESVSFFFSAILTALKLRFTLSS